MSPQTKPRIPQRDVPFIGLHRHLGTIPLSAVYVRNCRLARPDSNATRRTLNNTRLISVIEIIKLFYNLSASCVHSSTFPTNLFHHRPLVIPFWISDHLSDLNAYWFNSSTTIFTVRGSDDSAVFSIVAKCFFCHHDISWTAAPSSIKLCTNMYLDNP